MKVVVFDDLPEGGAKRVVYEQVKRLGKNNVVWYITNKIFTQFPFEQLKCTIHRFDMSLEVKRGFWRPLQEWSYISKIIPTLKQIRDLIDFIKPDVVIVHPSRMTQAPELLRMINQPRLYFAEEWPRVVYEKASHPLPRNWGKSVYENLRRFGVKYIDSVSAKSATKIVTTSTYMANCLKSIYHQSIDILPPGVDLSVFYRDDSDNTHKDYFLYIGEKESISGYPLLKGTDKPIKIVDFKNEGFKYTDKELADLYRGAIATLCLAENEPFGLTAIESMACGTPVIAVNSGGYLDTVIDGKTGILINPDKVDLTRAMEFLASNENQRNKLGKAGYELVMKKYNWDNHIIKLKKMLNQITI